MHQYSIPHLATADLGGTRAEIVEAAARHFHRYGYLKTTVLDVARETGMSAPNVYRFFGSKGELLDAVCANMTKASLRRLAEIAKRNVSASVRISDLAQCQHILLMWLFRKDRRSYELILVGLEQVFPSLARYVDHVYRLLADVIFDGIANDEFIREDPKTAASRIGAMLAVLCHLKLVVQRLGKENRANAKDLIAFVLRSLTDRRAGFPEQPPDAWFDSVDFH